MLGLLFVAAAAAGFLLARLTGRSGRTRSERPLSAEYFKGLNYLLNDQTDRAIEVFVRMVEVDSDTVETHFALGSLFRRRGEVDRAIRIHQNLIARPNLPRDQRSQALYELGEDYMRAGLFDRAENLFLELTDAPRHRESAIRQLIYIYEQQKDWEQAIAMRRKLEVISGEMQSNVVAHYFCELADEAWARGNRRKARQLVKRALAHDRRSIRAGMLSARLALEDDELKTALRQYRRVMGQDPAFVSEALPAVADCLRRLGRGPELDDIVRELVAQQPEAKGGVALVALDHPEVGGTAIQRIFMDYAQSDDHLRGVHEIVRMLSDADGDDDAVYRLQEVIRRLDTQAVRYRCRECGLKGNTLYWLCPSCKRWNSVRPTHEFVFSLTPEGTEETTGRNAFPRLR